MKYRKLGNSELEVPIITLGALNFGSFCDEQKSIETIQAAIDNGVNFQPQSYFDNLIANIYSITIRDANGCLFNIASNVIEPLSILSLGLSASDLLCFGDTTNIQSC